MPQTRRLAAIMFTDVAGYTALMGEDEQKAFETLRVLINAACFFSRADDKERSLTLLEKVFGKGFGKKEWIERDPDFDNVRKELRFRELLNKLK